MNYRIVEMFQSLQGEGYNTGMPAIFLRFGKCNLACHWCDTNYNQFTQLSLKEILQKVHEFSAKNIIITGGEPTIQPHLKHLLQILKQEGYFLAMETNGLKNVPTEIDYIATSPKRLYWDAYRKNCIAKADEVRIVADDEGSEILAFCQFIENRIYAPRYYLSPCEQNGKMNVLHTLQLLGQLNARPHRPHWQLNLQTHKLVGIE